MPDRHWICLICIRYIRADVSKKGCSKKWWGNLQMMPLLPCHCSSECIPVHVQSIAPPVLHEFLFLGVCNLTVFFFFGSENCVYTACQTFPCFHLIIVVIYLSSLSIMLFSFFPTEDATMPKDLPLQ